MLFGELFVRSSFSFNRPWEMFGNAFINKPLKTAKIKHLDSKTGYE